MTRNLRVLLVTTLITLTGCAAIQRSLKAGDPKTYTTAKELVRGKKYTEAATELRRLQAELGPDPKSKYGFSTYGDLVADVTRALVLEPLAEAESAVEKEHRRGEAAVAMAKLPDAFKAVEGLPLDELKSEKYARKALNERRAKVEAKAAAFVAGAEKQLAAIREDEQKGRIGFALYEWTRFLPASPAQLKERDEKLLGLAKQLYGLSGGRFTMQIAKGAAPNLLEGMVEGRRRAQSRLGNIAFVPSDEADAVVLFGAPALQVKRSSSDVKLEWKYPTGKREVENPDYGKLQEKIARLQKEAAWQKDKYDNVNCGRGGSVKGRTKFPSGDCAKAYYQAWQKYSKDAESARKSLARTKPRKVETVYSIYPYTAKESVVTVEQTVNAEVSYRDGRKERVSKQATFTLKAYTHPGHAPVKLKPRAEKLLADDVLVGQFGSKVAEQVQVILAQAQTGLLGAFKKEAEGSKDDVLRAEYGLRVLAQRSFKDAGRFEVEDRVARARLGEPLQEGPKLVDVFNRGADAVAWDRLTSFAEAEEGEQRIASAYAAWALTPTFDDASKAKKGEKVAALKAKLAEERVLAWAADAEGATGEIVKKLGELLSPLPGFPKASGAPRLKLVVAAAAPKVKRESGEVTLDHEYVVGQEEVENPEWVKREATRAACYESGDAVCITMWEMMPTGGTPETIVQKIMEQTTYKAKRDAAELEGEIALKLTLDGKDLSLSVPVTHLVEAFTHPAKADVKLAARSEKLPSEAELLAAWEALAAKAVFDALFDKLHNPEPPAAGAVMNGNILRAIRLKSGKDADWNLFGDSVKETLAVDFYRRGGLDLP